jgi:prephenate dehydratase
MRPPRPPYPPLRPPLSATAARSSATVRRITVAYQGEPGAFSEVAIGQLWGDHARRAPFEEFIDVVRVVHEGRAHAGVLPVANIIAGPVADSIAAIEAFPTLVAIAETVVRVELLLLCRPGVPFDAIRRVVSHPMALAQCGHFFARHAQFQPIVARDTAGAARDLAHRHMDAGATTAVIASRAAASRHGLVVVAEDIADRADNMTRFVALTLRGRAHPVRRVLVAGADCAPPAIDP